MRLTRGLRKGFDQKEKNKDIVFFLDKAIHAFTQGTVFDQLRTETYELLKANTLAHGTTEYVFGLAVNGEVFHPQMIKEITNIPYGSELIHLPLHRTMVKSFNEYITKNRDNLTHYAAVRNLILQALRTSGNVYEFMELIGLKNANIPIAVSMAYANTVDEGAYTNSDPEVIEEFKKKYANSIKTFEDFLVISSLFGDVL